MVVEEENDRIFRGEGLSSDRGVRRRVEGDDGRGRDGLHSGTHVNIKLADIGIN